VQKRVDAIQEGRGIADLVDDLLKLADLVEENASRLRKADLPKDASNRARSLAESIGQSAAARPVERSGGQAGADLLALRNRAFWYLREAMDAVRDAGRYVFRNEPKKVALFRASTTRPTSSRKKPTTNGQAAGPSPTP
ncbi:MAG TPA: hypothetical protein VIF62_22080, partial [Labilithrix sp.]